MDTVNSAQFYIAGIAVTTTNENGQSAIDIPQLWEKFFSENIMASIPNKMNDAIYCIYTDYELDYTRPYTTILGCRTDSLDDIPDGLSGKAVPAGKYGIFTAEGKMEEGIVYEEWKKIWGTDLPRAYTADFEIYGDESRNPEHAKVGIFVALT
jgi:predicted transcriptional regulator YdeE